MLFRSSLCLRLGHGGGSILESVCSAARVPSTSRSIAQASSFGRERTGFEASAPAQSRVTQLVDLVGEGVDVAVRAGSPPPNSTSVVAQAIFSMQRVLVAAPRWLRKHGAVREPEELARRACLIQVTPGGTTIPWSLAHEDAADATRVVDVSGQLRTNAPSALRDLALRGAGIAYLPDWLIASDLKSGSLKRVLPEWSSAPITAWAIYRAELRGALRLRAFLEALPASAAEVAP